MFNYHSLAFVIVFSICKQVRAGLNVNQHVLVSGTFKCTGKLCICPMRVFIEGKEASQQSKQISKDGPFTVVVKHQMRNVTFLKSASIVARDVITDTVLFERGIEENHIMADIGEINQYITSDCIENWLKKEYNESFINRLWDLASTDKSNCGMLVLLATSSLVAISMFTSLALSFCKTRSRKHQKSEEKIIFHNHRICNKKATSSDVFESLLIDHDFVKGYLAAGMK